MGQNQGWHLHRSLGALPGQPKHTPYIFGRQGLTACHSRIGGAIPTAKESEMAVGSSLSFTHKRSAFSPFIELCPGGGECPIRIQSSKTVDSNHSFQLNHDLVEGPLLHCIADILTLPLREIIPLSFFKLNILFSENC